MRKLIVLLVVLAALAACWFPVGNPFTGEWMYQNLLYMKFTETDVLMVNQSVSSTFTGTYTYDDTTLIIDWDVGPVEVIGYSFMGTDVVKFTWPGDAFEAFFIRK